jgi:HK97 family phage prohead protease
MAGLAPFRLCSTLVLKAVDEAERVIEGIASSSAPDGAGDVVESRGAIFELPMPLLMQHDKREPVGQVTAAKVSDSQIHIRAEIARDSGLEYVERAWKQLKAGLVRGLSIGAQPLKAVPIVDAKGRMTGIRYQAWRWLELSAVTLPMNIDATIDVVRAFDPWGAVAYATRHDLGAEGLEGAGAHAQGQELEEKTYEATRARAIAALQASRRATYRGTTL